VRLPARDEEPEHEQPEQHGARSFRSIVELHQEEPFRHATGYDIGRAEGPVGMGRDGPCRVLRVVSRLIQAQGLEDLFDGAGIDAPVLHAILADVAKAADAGGDDLPCCAPTRPGRVVPRRSGRDVPGRARGGAGDDLIVLGVPPLAR
jgi:hypothetical protein